MFLGHRCVGFIDAPTQRRGEYRGKVCFPKGARALLLGTDKSAFALLLTRVTEPKLLYYKEDYEENYQRDGG